MNHSALPTPEDICIFLGKIQTHIWGYVLILFVYSAALCQASHPLATQSWFHFQQTTRFSQRWSVRLDGMHSRADAVDYLKNRRFNYIRFGVGYHLGSWIFVPGYAYFRFYDRTKVVQEHRSYQFLIYNGMWRSLQFFFRARTEQRFFDTELPGRFADFRNRTSLLCNLQIPVFSNQIQQRIPYLLLTNETLLMTQHWVFTNLQNRLGTGMGINVASFQFTVVFFSFNNTHLPHAYVARVQIFHNLDLRKRNTAQMLQSDE